MRKRFKKLHKQTFVVCDRCLAKVNTGISVKALDVAVVAFFLSNLADYACIDVRGNNVKSFINVGCNRVLLQVKF